jgi:hypothetical protein
VASALHAISTPYSTPVSVPLYAITARSIATPYSTSVPVPLYAIQPAENESAIDLEKTIDVDEASHDSTQNSQQENGSVIIQDEIIEGRQSAAGNYNKKNKKTNSHKEVQQQNTQRSLKPIVIIGDSIIKHIKEDR